MKKQKYKRIGLILPLLIFIVFLHNYNKSFIDNEASTVLSTNKTNTTEFSTTSSLHVLRYSDFLVTQIDSSTIKVENQYVELENLSYAWYIIDADLSTVVYKTEFATDNALTYTFKDNGHFLIRGYIKSGSERTSLDILRVDFQDTQYTLTPFGNIKTSDIISRDRMEFGITLSEYNCNFPLPSDAKVLDIAEQLRSGKLVVEKSLPASTYDINDVNWNIEYSESPNTYQLYLQSLYPVMYLTRAYEITNKVDYLELAEKFINSWVVYKDSDHSNGNTFLWYDHGTALRAENLIYFTLVSCDSHLLSEEMADSIRELIEEHILYLKDSNKYTKNHNHGIFQDQALIYSAYFLNASDKEELLELAKNRLLQQKEYAFTSENVHVENSPGYQIGVMELFKVISEFLMQYEDTFAQDMNNSLYDAAEFMAYITKPNGVIAEIGDTNSLVGAVNRKYNFDNNFNNLHYEYAATTGLSGEQPTECSKVYKESGYYISHNSWSGEDILNTTWMMFKSGYVSKTHKHADDNSFMLYSKGYDIFVDPGWYNYMSGNPYRDYFVSSLAHNTVIVDENTYSPTTENSYKTGIIPMKGDYYDYIIGYNDMYNGVSIDRHFYNLGDAIILFDNIESEDEHTYSQLFHTSEYMQLISADDNEVLLKIQNTNYFVRIRQFLDDVKLNIIKGDIENGTSYGLLSREMNHLDEIYTVKCDVIGKKVNFITLITIEDENGDVENINNISFDSSNQQFIVENTTSEKYSINLKPRKRINLNVFDLEVVNNNVNIQVKNTDEPSSYAYYLIDKNTAKPITKNGYNNTKSCIFSLDNRITNEYLIRAYIKDIYGQRKQKIIADISWNSEKQCWENVTDKYQFLNLIYYGQTYEKVKKHTYRFTVQYAYDWNSSIKWYIYRNGGYYTSFTTANTSFMEYTFDEPGDYTIMYYLSTVAGDNEFWNYPEIKIE